MLVKETDNDFMSLVQIYRKLPNCQISHSHWCVCNCKVFTLLLCIIDICFFLHKNCQVTLIDRMMKYDQNEHFKKSSTLNDQHARFLSDVRAFFCLFEGLLQLLPFILYLLNNQSSKFSIGQRDIFIPPIQSNTEWN